MLEGSASLVCGLKQTRFVLQGHTNIMLTHKKGFLMKLMKFIKTLTFMKFIVKTLESNAPV